MNGFRVTLLVLFCVTVALMAYAIVVLIPARQEQYELYRTTLKINEYQQRNAEHTARMAQLGPEIEAPEVSNARNAAEDAARQRQQSITDAEESSVLAAAKRKQEERAAQEEAATAAATAAAPAAGNDTPVVLGHVTSYSSEWNSLLFKPESDTPMNDGLQIALRRNGAVVCEAVVDDRDEESGQVSATVKQVSFGGKDSTSAQAPEPGDEVIISPFLSSKDLQSGDAAFTAAVQQMQQGDASAAQQPVAPADNKLPEVDATLVPIP